MSSKKGPSRSAVRSLISYVASLSPPTDPTRAYKKYLRCQVAGVPVSALLDSGNLAWSAISLEFFRELGLAEKDLDAKAAGQVATAKAGDQLEVKGILRRPIRLTIQPDLPAFSFRPIVIDRLNMKCNISGKYMHARGWDQIHSKGAIRVSGKLVPLAASASDAKAKADSSAEQQRRLREALGVETPVVLHTNVRVPAGEAVIAELRAAPGSRSQLAEGDYYYRGAGELENRFSVFSAWNAILSVGVEGRPSTLLVNPTDRPIELPKNCPAGFLSSTEIHTTANSVLRSVRQGGQPALEKAISSLFAPAAERIEEDDGSDFCVSALSRIKRQRQDAWIQKFLNEQRAKSKRPKLSPGKSPDQRSGPQTPANRKDSSDDRKNWTLRQKENWLVQQFRLDKSPFLQNPADLREAVGLLLDFWDFFSHDGTFGHTSLVQHRIITEECPPIKEKYRPLNPQLEGEFKKVLDRWLEQGIVEPSDSPWAANLVVATKKTGSLRFCVDWRGLNRITRKDSFPMPSIQDCFTKLAGSTVFSAIDMEGAFHVISISPEDREKTAFSTPFGLFQQIQLGFGLTNGPPSYCRLVEKILRNVPSRMAIGFLDDAIIHSPDLRTHFLHLRVTLDAYRKAGLRMSPKKCSFFVDRVPYLGHEISAEGVRPMTDHLAAIRDWPLPQTKSEARSFLGTAAYYRDHIPRFSEIAQPWTDVMGKTSKEAEKTGLKVTEEMRASFELLKRKLTSAPVLGFPYFRGPKAGRFILDTDFSRVMIGGILSQLQDGKEVVISYGSKKLVKHQRHWHSSHGELYAGCYFMQHFAYYLKFCQVPFLWRTDNAALTYVRTLNCPSSTIERWLGILADFHFDVEHRAGKRHTNADGLSRSIGRPDHVLLAAEAGEEALEPEVRDDGLAFLSDPSDLPTVVRRSREELVRLQKEDSDLKLVREWLKRNEPPGPLEQRALSLAGRYYAGIFESLRLDERSGLIGYFLPNQDPLPAKAVTCLPTVLIDESIRLAHATGGHLGRDITMGRLRRAVFFPGMRKEVDRFIENCTTCQRKRREQAPQKHTLVSSVTGYPMQVLHIDIFGPITPTSRQGSTCILTCKDAFSKWVWFIPMKDQTASSVIRALEKEVFCTHGICEEIRSDHAKIFESLLFKQFCDLYGIRRSMTVPWNPKANAEAERVHRDLAPMLRSIAGADPAGWEDALPQIMFALRTSVHRSIGLSPYQLLFGRDVSQPLDTIFGLPDDYLEGKPESSREEYMLALRKRIDGAQQYVRDNIASAVVRQRRAYHQNRKSFLPGARVWLWTPRVRTGISKKLTNFWTGPWVICADGPQGGLVYRIAPDPSWDGPDRKLQKAGSIVVGIDRLKPYKDGEAIPPDEDSDLLMEGDENAEILRYGDPEAEWLDDDYAGVGGGGGPPEQPPPRAEADPGPRVEPPPPLVEQIAPRGLVGLPVREPLSHQRQGREALLAARRGLRESPPAEPSLPLPQPSVVQRMARGPPSVASSSFASSEASTRLLDPDSTMQSLPPPMPSFPRTPSFQEYRESSGGQMEPRRGSRSSRTWDPDATLTSSRSSVSVRPLPTAPQGYSLQSSPTDPTSFNIAPDFGVSPIRGSALDRTTRVTPQTAAESGARPRTSRVSGSSSGPPTRSLFAGTAGGSRVVSEPPPPPSRVGRTSGSRTGALPTLPEESGTRTRAGRVSKPPTRYGQE